MVSFKSVFGLNRRNRDLVSALNEPKLISLANNKITCKEMLLEHGIRTPKSIAEIHLTAQIPYVYPKILACGEKGFVVKPSQGAQGRAVKIFACAYEDKVLPQHDDPMTRKDFAYFISCIISGEFTSAKPIDAALVEERLRPSSSWIVPDLPGPPDLRIIVHQGKPVMCMARLPTVLSDGRANLHRGGVGLGVDLQSGHSTYAIWKNRPISHHPDSGHLLTGLEVEGLDECVEQARRCAQAVPLGYLGVDIMFDEEKGPCVIELNARPGLAIQMANRRGLGEVLDGHGFTNIDRNYG